MTKTLREYWTSCRAMQTIILRGHPFPVPWMKKPCKNLLQKNQLRGESYPTVEEALKTAVGKAGANDLVFVGGSTFVVAEVV
jgi:hypothetical protein